MNIAHEIHQLLHGSWNYQQAEKLYQQIGTCDINKYLFGLGENSHTADRLRAALEELEPDYPFQLSRATHSEPAQMPKEIDALVEQWKELYKKANHTRLELFKRDGEGKLIHPEKKRGELAHQVLAYFDEIERLWGAVDYFKEHGHIPPSFNKVELQITDPVEMHKRMKNLRSYICNARAGRKTYSQSIEEMAAELAELERRLK